MSEKKRKPQKAVVGNPEKTIPKQQAIKSRLTERTKSLQEKRRAQTERLRELQAEHEKIKAQLDALNEEQRRLQETIMKNKDLPKKERDEIVSRIHEIQTPIRELGNELTGVVQRMKDTEALTDQQVKVYMDELLNVSTWLGPSGEITMGDEEEEEEEEEGETAITQEELSKLLRLNQQKEEKLRELTNVYLVSDRLKHFQPLSLKKDIETLYTICKETFDLLDNKYLLFTLDNKYRIYSNGELQTFETAPPGITGNELKIHVPPGEFVKDMLVIRRVGSNLHEIGRSSVSVDDTRISEVYNLMTAHWHTDMDILMEVRRAYVQEQIRQERSLTKMDQLHWELQTIARRQELVLGEQSEGFRGEMSNAMSMFQTYVSESNMALGRAMAQLVSSSENKIMSYVSRELQSMHEANLNQFRTAIAELLRARVRSERTSRMQLREDLKEAIQNLKNDFPRLPPPLQEKQLEEFAGALVLRERGELVKVANELIEKQDMAVQLAPISKEIAKIRDDYTAKLQDMENVFRDMATNVGTLVGKIEGVETSLVTQGKTLRDFIDMLTIDKTDTDALVKKLNTSTPHHLRLHEIRYSDTSLMTKLWLYFHFQVAGQQTMKAGQIEEIKKDIIDALKDKPDIADLVKEQTKLIQNLIDRAPIPVMAPTHDEPSSSSAIVDTKRTLTEEPVDVVEEMEMDTPRRPAAEEQPRLVVPAQPAQPIDVQYVAADYPDRKDTRVSELQRHRLNLPKFRVELFGDIREAVVDEGLYHPANRARKAFGIYNRALDLAQKTPFIAKYNFVRA